MDDAGNTAATTRDLPPPAGPGRPPSTTRRQLQDIAIEMFSEQGYDEVTIEALAAAAGISRRTFFRYFSSKADALMAGFDADVERLRAVLAGSGPGLPLMDAIRNAVVEVNDYHADDLARLRQRLLLQHSNPALLANGILHYEEWPAAGRRAARHGRGVPGQAPRSQPARPTRRTAITSRACRSRWPPACSGSPAQSLSRDCRRAS